MDFVEKNAEIVPDAISTLLDFVFDETGRGSSKTGKNKRTTISAIKSELKHFINQLKMTVCYEN